MFFVCALLCVLAHICSAQTANSCVQLAACMQNLTQQQANCLDQREALLETRGQNLAECQRDVVNLGSQRQRLDNERVERVARCLGGQAPLQDPQDCSAYFDLSTNLRFKRQAKAGNETRKGKGKGKGKQANPNRPAQAVKQCQQNVKQLQRQCKQLVNSCPKSQICHQCYEMSTVHDSIKVANFQGLALRDRCRNKTAQAIRQKPSRDDQPLPDQDESFSYVHLS